MDEIKENCGDTRQELLETLGEVIDVALRKYLMVTVRNRDRQGWGRLIVSSVSEAGKLLKDIELDNLMQRVTKVEESGKK